MIREALASHAEATRRVFADRANSVGASEIGQCGRKVYFTKNEGDAVYGASPDDGFAESWGATLRGRLFEDYFWAPAMRARFRDRLLYSGDDQQTFTSGFLSATPDGLLIDLPRDALAHLGVTDIEGDRSVVLECKTIDPRVKLDEPKPEHVYQATVQMGLLRELTKHRPQWAVVSYANASFLDDVIEFPIAFDPLIFANAKARAAQIMTVTAADELKPEGWIAGGRECEYCPFTRACGRLRSTLPTQAPTEPPDPQFVAEIADLARETKRHQADADAATERLRSAQHEIKERLRAKSLTRIAGNGVSVVWSPVKGRQSFDMPGIRRVAEQAGIDLTPFETTGDPTDRLTISIRATASAAA
jgi:hypothetical protein